MAKRKMILDVDTGCDDAQALMMALAHSDVSVLALTCVHGNVNVDTVCANTQQVLRVCKRLDIPVYRGAAESLLGKTNFSDYHGADGLGGAADGNTPDLGLLQSEHAASAMVTLAKENPGQITIVCLAPLTNVALAMKLDPEFGKRIKELLIMGGNIEDTEKLYGRAEYNFFCDAEASDLVLRNIGCPITLLPIEVAERSSLAPSLVDSLAALRTPRAQFYSAITQVEQQRAQTTGSHVCADAVAMAVSLARSIAAETRNAYVTVEHSESERPGELVVDWSRSSEQDSNVTIVMKVDMNMLHCFMLTMLNKP